ncbi:hypothetical protein SBADM41S_12263 [Streptomyces badius]
MSTSRTLRLGAVYGCTISFWDNDPEESDMLVAPTRTLIGDRISQHSLGRASTVLSGRTYPTINAFAQPLHGDVGFPVDAVYTWVDGSDVQWLERKNQVLAMAGLETVDAAASAARFRSRDERRYSLRSIDMYAPWIRNFSSSPTGRLCASWLDHAAPRGSAWSTHDGDLSATRAAVEAGGYNLLGPFWPAADVMSSARYRGTRPGRSPCTLESAMARPRATAASAGLTAVDLGRAEA